MTLDSPRQLDITCSDEEPAIIGTFPLFTGLFEARNVLLFTLLLDDRKSITPRDLWDMYHNLYLECSTFEMIREQSEKLVGLSESIISWNKVYGDYFLMINFETLKVLNRFWRKFNDSKNSTSEFIDEFKSAVKGVYEKHDQPSNFAESVGPKNLFLQRNRKLCLESTKVFWKNGTAQPSSSELPFCNPLFFYSEGAGDRFCLDPITNPLSGYHLVTCLSELTPDSPFFQQRQGRDMLELAAEAAKMQFTRWTSAFRRFVRDEKHLRIRFFVGDALTLCIGIYQLSAESSVGYFYNRPLSSSMILMHDNCIEGPMDPPLLYNIIDAGYLIDDIGLLNLLPRVVPLLDPELSVLYTSTSIKVKEETDLLPKLLCGEVEIMSILLGVVPANYLTRITTIAHHIRTRIPWRLPMYEDPLATPSHSLALYDFRDLTKFLTGVHNKMFPPEFDDDGTQPRYTQHTFAMLVQFIKRRMVGDENQTRSSGLLMSLVEWLNQQKHGPRQERTTDELMLYFLLLSVQDWTAEREYGAISKDEKAVTYRFDHGVLKNQDPREVIALVITVPRAKIQPIYDICMTTDCKVMFEVHLITTDSTSKFTSIQPIFGKLIPHKDGQTGVIEEDVDSWYGSADLQLCMYVSSAHCLADHPRNISLSIRLNIAAHESFKSIYGNNLEVFKAKILNHQAVHLFEAMPGLHPANPPIIDPFADLAVAEVPVSLHWTRFDWKKREFSVLVAYVADDRLQVLKKKKGLTVKQIGPCTVLVTVNSFGQVCTFAYPVKDVRYDVFPSIDSIKVTASLITTLDPRFTKQPFSLIHRSNSTYNPSLPYINFRKLAKLDTNEEEVEWLNPHLTCMFSDRELALRGTSFDFMTNIKNIVHAMFFYPIVRLNPSKDFFSGPIVFFITGHYLDFNSDSLVAEAYFYPVPEDVDFPFEAADIHLNDEEMMFWLKMLPALIERCREFEHTDSCDYATEIPGSEITSNCSCGTGKIMGDGLKELLGDSWTLFQPNVTRVAISTLFVPPYIESTRTFYNAFSHGAHMKMSIFRYFGPIIDEPYIELKKLRCKVCWKEKSKKCVKCKEVAYCSKGCQTKDLKEHKKYCKLRTAA